jgi:hypothetical protein
MGLLQIQSPTVGCSLKECDWEMIWLIRKDFPVLAGPIMLAKDIGGANERRTVTASACSTIFPKELMEMNCRGLLAYFSANIFFKLCNVIINADDYHYSEHQNLI